MPKLRSETGVALPVTIFVIALLTITLAASFVRVDAERAIAVGTGDAVSALTVAQAGLRGYIGSRTSAPPDGDSVRVNVTGGYADVRAYFVRRPANTLLDRTYIVRSTGYVIVPEMGAVYQGTRTVAQFAQYQTGLIRRVAAFVAANGLTDNSGGQIRIQGTDQCGGIVPTGSVRTTSGPALNDGTYTPVPIRAGNGDAVADTTGIDWTQIVNGNFFADEYTLITGEWLNKSYLVRGNATLAAGTWGQGLLIVTGDLTTTGGGSSWARWYGVILVGGRIIFNANRTEFRGLVVSGLNEQLGGTPPPAGTIGGGGGSARYYIDYCADDVDDVIAPLTGLVPIRNAWVDNWATY